MHITMNAAGDRQFPCCRFKMAGEIHKPIFLRIATLTNQKNSTTFQRETDVSEKSEKRSRRAEPRTLICKQSRIYKKARPVS